MNDRLKRLLYRSRYRGSHENDLLIGRFAEVHLAELSAEQLDRFEALLECGDNDLYDWITGKHPASAECENDVMHLIRKFNPIKAIDVKVV